MADTDTKKKPARKRTRKRTTKPPAWPEGFRADPYGGGFLLCYYPGDGTALYFGMERTPSQQPVPIGGPFDTEAAARTAAEALAPELQPEPKPEPPPAPDVVDALATRCRKCGSTRRSGYSNKNRKEMAGTVPGTVDTPYTAVIWRTCRCLDCGQVRRDRQFVNEP